MTYKATSSSAEMPLAIQENSSKNSGHADPYKVKELQKMLQHETAHDETHYGARLTHWCSDAKVLTIDAGGLQALIDYYSTHDTNLG